MTGTKPFQFQQYTSNEILQAYLKSITAADINLPGFRVLISSKDFHLQV